MLPSGSAAATVSGATPVVIGTVTREDVPIEVGGLGIAQASLSVTARARVTGYLTSIGFHEGQRVNKGDLLATVDARPYQATLDGAAARLAGDAASLANDERTVSRDRALLVDHVVSSQQADADAALTREAAASVAADRAAVDAATLDLAFCRITAPIDGVAGFRLADAGSLVGGADTAIVQIAQVQPIAVVFTLPEAALPNLVRAKGSGPLRVGAVDPRTGERVASGVVAAIDNTIDASSGTISVKAIFGNRDGHLWPGQYVRAVVRLGVRHDAVVAPAGALQHGPEALFVYALGVDGRVRYEPVQADDIGDGRAVVTAGLAAGTRVVTDGQSRLDDGVAVEPVAAAP